MCHRSGQNAELLETVRSNARNLAIGKLDCLVVMGLTFKGAHKVDTVLSGSCVQNLLQIRSWLRWWALVGNAQRCPQGKVVRVQAAMRRASFLCSRRSSMLR